MHTLEAKPTTAAPIIVPATASPPCPRQRDWTLTLHRCPFCAKKHTHGTGSAKRPRLGERHDRLSHCLRGAYEVEVVEIEEDTTDG